MTAWLALASAWVAAAPGFETVQFPSADGLSITADLYQAHPDPKTPFIVLFHQAGWSRGEYRAIAPRLNALGYNCLAVDQRSGNAVDAIKNETAKRAKKKKLPTQYLDALPDMKAALRWARKHHAKGPLIGWGSSYSSALILHLAGASPDLMDGALAFAPGEYFRKKSATFVGDAAQKIAMPVFITSAKKERSSWWRIYESIPSKKKAYFLPKTKGQHGSRALWTKFPEHGDYWRAVEAFLKTHFSVG